MTRNPLATWLLAAGMLALSGLTAAQPAGPGADTFTLAAGGDMIGPYHAVDLADPGFAGIVALFRGADLGFANQEGSIFDMETFAGYPAAENGGGYPRQPAAAAQTIKAIGIGLVSKANNHATDWGQDGLVATLQSLAAAGVVEAGAGMSEAEARAPAYVQTRGGLVALVDAASTFPPMAVAGPAVNRRGVISRPRPGLSALHVREVRLVSAAQLARLRALPGALPSAPGEVRIGDQLFRAAKHPGTVWEMDQDDEAAILAAVREARAKARYVIFSIHAHETGGDVDEPGPGAWEPLVLHKANEAPSPNDPRPAGFEPELFHAAIDAGADVVIRTGPHVTGGVEIYKGKPIFYSLGSLFFDFGGRRSFTSPGGETLTFPDAWFETILPVMSFDRGRLSEVRLYPLTIRSDSGVAERASGADAARILSRLKAQSAAFGATVQVEGAVGVIRPPPL